MNSLGHSNTYLIKAINKQSKKVWHVSNAFKIPEGEKLARRLTKKTFADKILEVAPEALPKIQYCDFNIGDIFGLADQEEEEGEEEGGNTAGRGGDALRRKEQGKPRKRSKAAALPKQKS